MQKKRRAASIAIDALLRVSNFTLLFSAYSQGHVSIQYTIATVDLKSAPTGTCIPRLTYHDYDGAFTGLCLLRSLFININVETAER